MTEKVNNYVRYLLDNGLLFEINRKVLHPLGLALVVNVDEENRKKITIDGLIKVPEDDKEGFVYDDETFTVGSEKYEKFLEKYGRKRLELRKEELGYIIQEK